MSKHFIDGNFPFAATISHLPTKVYGQALDRLVISTLDIVAINPQGKILLGQRAWEPMKGIFFLIGGSRHRGESFEETAARILKTELGIEAKLDRFQELGFYSLAFAKRRQLPQNHGVHTDSHVFMIKLVLAEVRSIKPNEEYSQFKWLSPNEMIKKTNQFHPMIAQIGQDLISRNFYGTGFHPSTA